MYKFPKDKVVDYLKELSDEDYQRRVWLASSGPEVSSFAEAVSGLFDDTGLGDALQKGLVPVFDPEIDEGLKALDQIVTEAGHAFQSMPPASVIEHPTMRKIRSIAASILAQMDQQGIL